MTECIWCGKSTTTQDFHELYALGWVTSLPPDSLRSDLEYLDAGDWYCPTCIVKCERCQVAERAWRISQRTFPAYYLKAIEPLRVRLEEKLRTQRARLS
jgi:hypothetical protein